MLIDRNEPAWAEARHFAACRIHTGRDPAKIPRTTCEACWEAYNLEHGLHLSNRRSKTAYKADMDLIVTDALPLMEPLLSRGGALDRDSLTSEVRAELASRAGELRLEVMGIDVALGVTGVSMVWHDADRDVFCVQLARVHGLSMPKGPSIRLIEERKRRIAQEVLRWWRVAAQAGESDTSKGEVAPVLIEDHAYRRQMTASATQIVELHGVLKSQFYAKRQGRPMFAIASLNMRTEVFGKSPRGSGDKTKALLRTAFDASPYAGATWAEDMGHDELDAWALCALWLKQNHPYRGRYWRRHGEQEA